MIKIVLASASPRRKELIKYISDNVLCVPSGEEETLPDGITASEIPVFLSSLKARSVAKDYPDEIVIGSDTVVILGEEVLSKPMSQADAFNKLKALSVKKHKVVTACTIIKGGKEKSFKEETFVEFYKLDDKEINDYIETNEPMDKAGAYGIQGRGSLFVKGIDGDYFNVVGLPVARLSREIKAFI